MASDSSYKILYIRTTEDIYNQIIKNAKAHDLALNKYVSMCVSHFDDKDIPQSSKNDKVLYCRVSEEEYNLFKSEAKKYNMELHKFIKTAILNDVEVDVTNNTRSPKKKALYCRVDKELHDKALMKAKEHNMTLTEYVTYCVINYN